MTSSKTWEQWAGQGYSAEKPNPTIYYFPGTVDIERVSIRDELAQEIQFDGVTPSRHTAHELLESAIVIHGQVETIDGELWVSEGNTFAHEATWVELDEYAD